MIRKRTRDADKYGRTSTYAYLEDGKPVNKEIIRQGYGLGYSKFRFRPLNEFLDALDLVQQARERVEWPSRYRKTHHS